MNRIGLKKLAWQSVFIGLFSTAVHSHEFLSELLTQQTMGGNNVFTPVANFQLTKAEILEINQVSEGVDYYQDRSKGLVAVKRDPKNNCQSSGSKTCGQFDHFSQARSAAVTTCYQLGQEQAEFYPAGLVPLYLGPSTFVDSDSASIDHHLNYILDQGLSFNCGYLTLNNDVNS